MAKRKHPVVSLLCTYGLITLGCGLYALGFNWCFQPNALAFGGFTGLGQIVNRLVPALPVGAVVFALNLPLFFLGVRRLGWRLLLTSLYAMAVSSAAIDLVAAAWTFPPMGDNLLAAVFGGVLVGLSMGLLLLVGATTGGSELLARLLKFPFPQLSIGRLCLMIDVVIVSAYALTFRSLTNALYGVVAMYISSQVMDMVIYGSLSAKLAYVVTSRGEAVRQRLLDLDVGVTVLPGRGGYTGQERAVFLCAFKLHQIAAVKRAVMETDPAAFLIVCQAHEVLGEGFGAYSPENL